MSDTNKLAMQWRSVSHLLDEALLLPASERERWLAELPVEQIHLRETLRHFLELHARIDGEGFLASPAQPPIDMVSVTPLLSPGASVGPYRVIEELGAGGMGSVWLAERSDKKPRRRVALKLPRMVWASDLSARLERERDILASLEHPNIARLYDAGLDDQARPYLAIEYVEGIRITQYCREHQLSPRQRVELFLQVLAAVQYAHTRLVLHRDLKPSNILVNRNGDVRLLDFGIAKLIEDSQADSESDPITVTRALTPRYASPEQLRGERLTLVSDVYSLGVILYELLAELSPYPVSAKSRVELELAVMEGVLTPPSRRVASSGGTGDLQLSGLRLSRILRGDLDAIVLKSLALDVHCRYASVEALAKDLQRWLDGRPVLASAPSKWVIAQKFALRNRAAVSIATAATIMILATSGVAIYQAKKATAESQRAAATRDFLIDMFEGANPELHGGREATVRELLSAAMEKLSKRQATDPFFVAETYAAISTAWLKFGNDANAVVALRKRFDSLARAGIPSQKLEAKLDEGRLAAHAFQIDYLREVLASTESYKSEYSDAPVARADRYWLLGWVALEDGRMRDAEANFRSSLAISEKIGDELRISRSYYGIASASTHFAASNEVIKIIESGLTRIDESRLDDWQKIQRRFELISCLAILGEYQYGWLLMWEVFQDAQKLSGKWVLSQVEIYSYVIAWALRVGEIEKASRIADSIEINEIPDSLKKADLVLSAALVKTRNNSIDEALGLVAQAFSLYEKLDTRRSYKATAFLAEVAVVGNNLELLRNVVESPSWTQSESLSKASDKSLLLNWYSGVERFYKKDFESASSKFVKALEIAKELGPEGHPRVSLIKLAIVRSSLAKGEISEKNFDTREIEAIGKKLRGSYNSDSEPIKELEFVESQLISVIDLKNARSAPTWRLSLL